MSSEGQCTKKQLGDKMTFNFELKCELKKDVHLLKYFIWGSKFIKSMILCQLISFTLPNLKK